MDNYLNAKLLLLDQVKDKSKVIYNQDDPYLGKEEKLQDGISYGFTGKNLKMFEYQDTDFGTHLVFKYKDKFHYVDTKLKNRFNVYNYIMSAILTSNLGYDLDEVLSHSMEIDPPAGRCDVVPYNQGKIIVDYAHTPDAVEKIITSFQENNDGRIITIIGCGGDRDKTKRPIMGNIASEKSDFVIVTSDNPRTEDPQSIIDQVKAGIKKDNYIEEIDRTTAIQKGIEMLNPNDILLVLGKGHEDYQIIGHDKIHLDDHEIINNWKKEHTKVLTKKLTNKN
jgi:UDP-N-acetylmuramoyl-L-alanyl-D-glutamate--2,6-diaminopimelate ligase